MAKLVLGTDINNTGTPSFVRDVSPEMYRNLSINSSKYLAFSPSNEPLIDFAQLQIKGLDEYVGYEMYKNRLDITDLSLILSNISSMSAKYCCYGMFRNCSNITGNVNLRSVDCIYIAQYCCSYMFAGCTGITSVDLSNLRFVNGNYGMNHMFDGCTNLTSVDIGNCYSFNASDIGSQLFSYCTSLKEQKFNSLELGNYAAFIWGFYYSGIENIYFPAIQSTTATSTIFFDRILYGTTGVTIHFPKNLDPQTGNTTISRMSGYPTFGGTDSILTFDLPSTLILNCANSNAYKRNPNFDTATTLAWVLKNKHPNESEAYYTSTLNDPQVGDTIYSDPECTQVVTTISSIA